MPAKPAPETLSIRVAAHQSPDVTRLVELRSEQKLRDLVAAVGPEFLIEDPAGWRVFLSNKPWDRASAWGHDDRGKQVRLREMALEPGAKFLMVLNDNAERWLRCEVTARGAAEAGVKYPRVTERVGEAPNPYAHLDGLFGLAAGQRAQDDNEDEDEDVDEGDEDEDEETDEDGAEETPDDAEEPVEEDDVLAPATAEEKALLDRAAESARAWDEHFEREDAADAPRPKEQLTRDAEVARALGEAFRESPQRFDALTVEYEEPIAEWLDMLPFDLEDHAMYDQALALCEPLAPLLGPANMGATRATILLAAQRRDEALSQAEATVWEFPDDPETRARIAGTFQRAGELTRAEDLARSVLDAALDDSEASAYLDAIAVLGEVLRATGRASEARLLEQSEQAQRGRAAAESGGDPEDMFDALGSMLGAAPAVRTAAPRVGRNDPCPCGSGKKYRECHGAA